MPEVKRVEKGFGIEREEYPEVLRIQVNEQNIRDVFNLSLREGRIGDMCRFIWEIMIASEDGHVIRLDPYELEEFGIDQGMIAGFKYAIEEQRLLDGEETPEIIAFKEAREKTQAHIRKLRRQYQREEVRAASGFIPERFKIESDLFHEVDEVVQKMAKAMGFKRDVITEITQGPEANLFILQAEKEGEDFNKPSNEPFHVFINAGFIHKVQEMGITLSGTTFELSKDHIAAVVGHELGHLMQPKYNPDKPPEDKETSQRFEFDADLRGFEAMDQAGYNVEAMIEVLTIFDKFHGGDAFGRTLNKLLGTHPHTKYRIIELQREYQRPDRTLFYATQPQEPLSESAVNEAGEWTLSELLERMGRANSDEDWAEVFEFVEKDPKADFWDAMIAFEYYWFWLQVRSVMAAGAHEWQTGEYGIRNAILYTINADAALTEEDREQRKYSNFFNPLQTSNQHFDEERRKEMLDCLDQVVVYPGAQTRPPGMTLTELAADFRPETILEEKIQKILQFTYKHATDTPPKTPPFATWEELFDDRNPEAGAYWRGYFLRSRVVGKEKLEKMDDFELLQFAKEYVFRRMSKLFYGVSEDITLHGEHATNRKQFLELIEKELEKKAKTPTQVETSGMFGEWRGVISRVTETLEGRVSVGAPGEQGGIKVVDDKEEREQRAFYTDTIKTDVFLEPSHLPDVFFDSTPPSPEGLSDLEQLTAFAVSIVRNKFDAYFSEENLQEILGKKLPDNPELKDWLFRRIVRDFMNLPPDWKDGQAGKISPQEARKYPELPEYLHALSRERAGLFRYVPRPTYSQWGHSGYCGNWTKSYMYNTFAVLIDDMKRKTPIDQLDRALERVRFFQNTPYLNGYRLDLSGIKKNIFKKWLESGFGASAEKAGRHVIDEALLVLEARAKDRGLPEEFYHPDFKRNPGWRDWLRSWLPGFSSEDEQFIKQELALIADELYLAYFADDASEITFKPKIELFGIGVDPLD